MRFSPEGDVIASGSHDKHIFLWRTYGECENYMMLKGACAWVGWGGGRAAGCGGAMLRAQCAGVGALGYAGARVWLAACNVHRSWVDAGLPV